MCLLKHRHDKEVCAWRSIELGWSVEPVGVLGKTENAAPWRQAGSYGLGTRTKRSTMPPTCHTTTCRREAVVPLPCMAADGEDVERIDVCVNILRITIGAMVLLLARAQFEHLQRGACAVELLP